MNTLLQGVSGISYMLNWDKEAIIQPKTINLVRDLSLEMYKHPAQGGVTPTPKTAQCRESSFQRKLLWKYSGPGAAHNGCDRQQVPTPNTKSRQDGERNAMPRMGAGARRTSVGLELPRERGCSPGSAAPQRRLLTRQGHKAGRETWEKLRFPLLSTATSCSARGEVTGRNKAKPQAWNGL